MSPVFGQRRSRLAAGCFALSLALFSAPPPESQAAERAGMAAPKLSDVLTPLRVRLEQTESPEALVRAKTALALAADLNLPKASQAINEAVQLDPRNSYLHFFNGFIYHLQSRQGDGDKVDLAIEGYQQAIRFDPNNWIAHEFMGLALMEQKQYVRAQSAFAEVLLARPDDPEVLNRMLAASYLSGDSATACAVADQLDALKTATPGMLRSSVIVYAACGNFEKAKARRAAFSEKKATAEELSQLDRRLLNWQNFYKSNPDIIGSAAEPGSKKTAGLMQTQYPPGSGGSSGFGSPSGFGGSSGFGAPGQPGGAADQGGCAPGSAQSGSNRMVLVDVVMVRTEDTISTKKGINLLNALNLQFGSSTSPAFSRLYSETSIAGNSTGTTTLTRAITVPALAYSLNIANATSNLNEVLARPTLAAVECMRSEFFSGTALNAAVVSSGNGLAGSAISIEKRYGVKLTITPQILKDGNIRLSVEASRTFLKPPSSDISFTYKLEISEILANANVVMRMGDTLILGGLSEKESTSNRDGVPLAQDVPLLQYFFSQQTKTDYQKSVLMLITPRPASFTWLSEKSKAAFANSPDDSFTPSLDVMRARFSDWFKPYPNLASVFHHLNGADLYREFRTGDVTLETWDRMDSTRIRLKQAVDFLYY
jgi:tetratricopeptide (TPR) repeat protein